MASGGGQHKKVLEILHWEGESSTLGIGMGFQGKGSARRGRRDAAWRLEKGASWNEGIRSARGGGVDRVPDHLRGELRLLRVAGANGLCFRKPGGGKKSEDGFDAEVGSLAKGHVSAILSDYVVQGKGIGGRGMESQRRRHKREKAHGSESKRLSEARWKERGEQEKEYAHKGGKGKGKG